jgi:hypothetical protein
MSATPVQADRTTRESNWRDLVSPAARWLSPRRPPRAGPLEATVLMSPRLDNSGRQMQQESDSLKSPAPSLQGDLPGWSR